MIFINGITYVNAQETINRQPQNIPALYDSIIRNYDEPLMSQPIEKISDNSFKDTSVITTPYIISDSVLYLLDTIKHSATWQQSPPSVFKPQLPGNINFKKQTRQPRWIFTLLMLQLMALIYLKATFFKRIEEYLKAYFNINLSQQLFRDYEPALSLQAIVFMFNFLASCALLIYLLINYFFHPTYNNSFFIFIQIFIGVAVVYAVKYSGYLIIGKIFPFKEDISLFSFNYFLNQKLLGVILIPFIYASVYMGYYYTKFFLIASVLLFLISIGIRSIKGMLIGIKYLRQNAFHFLLYICTFEIAPLMILIRWLHTLANNGHN